MIGMVIAYVRPVVRVGTFSAPSGVESFPRSPILPLVDPEQFGRCRDLSQGPVGRSGSSVPLLH